MLVVVLITFAVTWLPSMMMEILRYNAKVRPKGNFSQETKYLKNTTVQIENQHFY